MTLTTLLEGLGLGALWAAMVLPLLVAAVGNVSNRDPKTRHAVLMWPLSLAALTMLLPWLRGQVVSSFVRLPLTYDGPTALELGDEGTSFGWFAVVGAVYVVSACLVALRLAIRWARLRWVLSRTTIASNEVRAISQEVAASFGIAEPMVMVSTDASVPFVAGIFRPWLVWPAALLESLSQEQRHLVVQHELSHIARGDHRSAPLIALFEIIFPFHPTAKRLLRELAIAREEAVDARIRNEHLHAYAHLLVTVGEHATQGASGEVVAITGGSLERRIAALTGSAPRPIARVGRLASVGAVLLGGLLVFAPKAVADDALHVAVGHEVELLVPAVVRVAIGSPEICDVRMNGSKRVVLRGVTPGQTSLLVWAGPKSERTAYLVSVE